eukprot:1193136-Prorocentrum_minimum.AAC.1
MDGRVEFPRDPTARYGLNGQSDGSCAAPGLSQASHYWLAVQVYAGIYVPPPLTRLVRRVPPAADCAESADPSRRARRPSGGAPPAAGGGRRGATWRARGARGPPRQRRRRAGAPTGAPLGAPARAGSAVPPPGPIGREDPGAPQRSVGGARHEHVL